ncbi:MAG: hypothetical protein ACP5VS_04800 [Desulfomonilaceae bacterium]
MNQKVIMERSLKKLVSEFEQSPLMNFGEAGLFFYWWRHSTVTVRSTLDCSA